MRKGLALAYLGGFGLATMCSVFLFTYPYVVLIALPLIGILGFLAVRYDEKEGNL